MNDQDLKNFVNRCIEEKMDSMTNMSVPSMRYTGWDTNQIDPGIGLLGFPVIQVPTASVAPTDIQQNGYFRFQVDTTPQYYLWAYLNYQSGAVLTGAWKGFAFGGGGSFVVSFQQLFGDIFYLATSACTLRKLGAVHDGTGTATVKVQKLTGTQVPGSGTDLLVTPFDMASSSAVPVFGTLTGGTVVLAQGDRIASYVASGSMAGITSLCISAELTIP